MPYFGKFKYIVPTRFLILLRVNPSRPVLIPISTLADVTIRLLQSTGHITNTQKQGDAVRIQLERQTVPELVKVGATLTCILAKR